MNDSFIFLFFRRMRTPLVVLISAYAIATAGFTLMPGVDDQGNPWRLSVFEAFYVVSYTGSTIGFGEVPYPFSPAQRLWTMVSIYLTVFAWLFSIGTIISLLEDPAFRTALRRARFRRAIRGLSQPFYLVCGYGDTGRMLVRALTAQRHPVVVLDTSQEKIDGLSVARYAADVAPFCMDARLPDNLIQSGLRSRWCLGVFAVTGDDRTNLKIAISAKLLNQSCIVQARADRPSVAENMRSFDTNHVVDTVAEYVERLRLAFVKPAMFALYQWMASGPDARIPDVGELPRGHWILCGYSRLGRAMNAMLEEIGLTVTVIEQPGRSSDLPDGAIEGPATQAETLQAAGIESAQGIVATTADDVDNLSILVTARDLNPDLFAAILENGRSSHELFRAAEPDLVGQPSTVIAGAMLARSRSPLARPFFTRLLAEDDAVGDALLQRLKGHQSDRPPTLLTVRISERRAPALARWLEHGGRITIGELLRHPARAEESLPLEALLLRRDDKDSLLPSADTALELGDRLLLAGRDGCSRWLESTLQNDTTLTRLVTGQAVQQGWVWRWLSNRRRAAS